MKNLVFLGPPGAGKGTQAQRVGQRLSLTHISTGEMLRAAIRENTQLGAQAKAYIDRGELVPDGMVIRMVGDRLEMPDCREGYILDGFPRTIPQAQSLEKVTDVSAVIDIFIEDEELVERLNGRRTCPACGHTTHVEFIGGGNACPDCGAALIQRDDDKPETIRNRLTVYHTATQPLIDYYTQKGLLTRVYASRGFEALTEDIVALVGKL